MVMAEIKKVEELQILDYWIVEYSFSNRYDGGGGGCTHLFFSKANAIEKAHNLVDYRTAVIVYRPIVIEDHRPFDELRNIVNFDLDPDRDRAELLSRTEKMFSTKAVDQYLQWRKEIVSVDCHAMASSKF